MLEEKFEQLDATIKRLDETINHLIKVAQDYVETVPVETVPVETVPVETVPVETVPVETVPVKPKKKRRTKAEMAALREMELAQKIEDAKAPVQAAPVQAVPVQAAPVQAAPVQAVPVQAAPVQAAAVQQDQPIETLETPPLSARDVQNVFIRKANELGGTEQAAKAIVKVMNDTCGSQNLLQIPEENFPMLIAKVEALTKEGLQ